MTPRTSSPTRDLALGAIARRHFGAFCRLHALGVGFPSSTIDDRIASGRWRCLLPGVMADAGTPDSWELRAWAALLAVGGEVVLARQSAARLWGVDLPPSVSGGLALLLESRTFPTLPAGIAVHRTRLLPSEHVDIRRGFPTTTATRTICDLTGQMGPIAIRRSVAHAVRNDLTDASQLRATADELGRIRGKRHLLRVCDELSPLEADCRSELESRFVQLMTRMGLPPTAMNHPVRDVRGRRRFIDAAYLPQHLPIELDSRAFHGTKVDRGDDLGRENDITLVGWRSFLRFSWGDLHERPADVVATVRDALDAADHDLHPPVEWAHCPDMPG